MENIFLCYVICESAHNHQRHSAHMVDMEYPASRKFGEEN